MQDVAGKCKTERHHPEWWNVGFEMDNVESFNTNILLVVQSRVDAVDDA